MTATLSTPATPWTDDVPEFTTDADEWDCVATVSAPVNNIYMDGLRVSDLRVDTYYQRDLDKTFIRKMARNYNPRLDLPLEVSERSPGKFFIMDGQHRHELNRILQREFVWCRIHTGLNRAQEANLFIQFQVEKKNISKVQRHKAAVVAKHADAVEIDKIVKANGFTIASGAAPGVINAAGNLYDIHRRYGAEGLEHTLEVLATNWRDQSKCTHGNFLTGLAMFLSIFEPYLEDSHFARVRRLSPADIIALSGIEGLTGKGKANKQVTKVLRDRASAGKGAKALPSFKRLGLPGFDKA